MYKFYKISCATSTPSAFRAVYSFLVYGQSNRSPGAWRFAALTLIKIEFLLWTCPTHPTGHWQHELQIHLPPVQQGWDWAAGVLIGIGFGFGFGLPRPLATRDNSLSPHLSLGLQLVSCCGYNCSGDSSNSWGWQHLWNVSRIFL